MMKLFTFYHLTYYYMGKIKQKNIKREFLLTLKSKERYRWFKDIQRYIKEGKTAKEACKLARVSRGEYYY